MNAYELADINDWSCCAHVKEVSAMLRQQADRIKRKQELIREQTALLVKQNNHIAELEDRLSMYEIKDLDRGLDENRK